MQIIQEKSSHGELIFQTIKGLPLLLFQDLDRTWETWKTQGKRQK